MTNQFTDEQVTAARQARNSHDFVGHGKCRCGAGGFTSIGHGQHQVRAALEAAAGVAPQEPSERTPEFESREQELFKHQPVLSMKDGGIAGCKCMDRVFSNQTEDWGTHLAEVFDALAAPVQPSGKFQDSPETENLDGEISIPVQPSSTVDEDALAEVIRRSYENEQGLKIRDDKRTARAVAEWLRGESR